jgi:hypothetical protein
MGETAPRFLPAGKTWSMEVKRAYRTFQVSETAKFLRKEDVWAVRRLYDYLNQVQHLWDTLINAKAPDKEAVAMVATLENIISRLSTSVGLGPKARQSLGISTQRKPGSKFDDFLSGAGEGSGES